MDLYTCYFPEHGDVFVVSGVGQLLANVAAAAVAAQEDCANSFTRKTGSEMRWRATATRQWPRDEKYVLFSLKNFAHVYHLQI
jgi:hypothetical protein